MFHECRMKSKSDVNKHIWAIRNKFLCWFGCQEEQIFWPSNVVVTKTLIEVENNVRLELAKQLITLAMEKRSYSYGV